MNAVRPGDFFDVLFIILELKIANPDYF